MPLTLTRDELVARLVRAGELEVSGEDQAETDAYFDTENFLFHGPDGFDADYQGLMAYFQSIRDAFDDRTIRRGTVVAEGNAVACQTWIEGTFVRPFTQSPAGRLEPERGPRRLGPHEPVQVRRRWPAGRRERPH